MLSIADLIRWTGITVFEIWLHILGLIAFSILIVLKLEAYPLISYWHVFSPLFIVTALNSYFLFIVLIRSMLEENECKGPIMKYALCWLRLIMIGIFEAWLCYKVNGDLEDGQVAVQSSYGVVFLPVWLLMAALCFQACRLL